MKREIFLNKNSLIEKNFLIDVENISIIKKQEDSFMNFIKKSLKSSISEIYSNKNSLKAGIENHYDFYSVNIPIKTYSITLSINNINL